ncbi:DUF368 domain-containing protein [Spirochaetota bacterium]
MTFIKYLFDGAVIGIANIIPGVSGGTMALVLGIYERIISAINNISLTTIKAVFGIFRFNKTGLESFKEEMKRIDALFLSTIMIGALIAIVAFAKLMTYLLKSWHDPTYGLFFGLVLVSVIAPYRLIRKKTFTVFLSAIIAMAAVFAVSTAVSGDAMLEKAKVKHELKIKKESSDNNLDKKSDKNILFFLYLFFLGAVSISAMILPGVSGSFLLLLMGGYFKILIAIVNRDLTVIAVFAAGCLFGLIAFSKLLNYLLKKWHDITMSFLVGLVMGSLWMIWPFKTSAVVGDEVIYLANRIPQSFGKLELYTLLTAFTGAALVVLFLLIEIRRNKKA